VHVRSGQSPVPSSADGRAGGSHDPLHYRDVAAGCEALPCFGALVLARLSDSGDQLSCFTQADVDLLAKPNCRALSPSRRRIEARNDRPAFDAIILHLRIDHLAVGRGPACNPLATCP
jgi:hypothetical protein